MSDLLSKVFYESMPKPQDVTYSLNKGGSSEYFDEHLWINPSSGEEYPLYWLQRQMGDDLNPHSASQIEITERNGREKLNEHWLAFSEYTPCEPEQYKKNMCEEDDSTAYWCYPEKSLPCRTFEDVYTGHEAEYLAEQFPNVGTYLTKFYSAHLDFILRNDGTKDVDIQKIYYINEDGSFTSTRSMGYDNRVARDQMQTWKKWDHAQECDKYREMFKDDLGNDVPFGSGMSCFDFKIISWSTTEFFPDRPRYDVNLVGTKEPPHPGKTVDEIWITDEGNDGTTDYARGGWLNSPGRFDGPSCFSCDPEPSPYTEGMLKYFDPLFKNNVENNRYTFRCQAPIAKVFVKEGDVVEEGDVLFAFHSAKEIINFHAEIDGEVTNVSKEPSLFMVLRGKESEPWYAGILSFFDVDGVGEGKEASQKIDKITQKINERNQRYLHNTQRPSGKREGGPIIIGGSMIW